MKMRMAAIVVGLALGWTAAGQDEGVEVPEPVAPAEPVLRTVSERDWTLSVRLETYSDQEFVSRDVVSPGVRPTPRITVDEYDRYDLERAAVVFPILEGSATHDVIDRGISGTLRFDTRIVDEAPRLVAGYQAGERLSVWHANGVENANAMRLWIDVPMRARSVDFDEARAMQVGWPEGAWPAVCASALQGQLGVDPTEEAVFDFVLDAVGPKPYADPPALVAKRLAGAVIETFQPSGLGYEFGRDGFFAGIDVRLEPLTANELVGSPADMAAFYCATLRAAGVPARLVVGYDLFAAPEAESEGLQDLPGHCGQRFQEGDRLSYPRLTYWVEFALFDEAANTLEWVPVDVIRQREVSSRAPAMDREWLFFGNHSCAEALIPLSHHLFPPTTVVGAGAPLLWGWIATPETPSVEQTLRIWVSGTPVTTGQEPVFPEE